MPDSETILRLGIFFGCLVLLLGWEQVAPRRKPAARRWARRFANFTLVFVSTFLIQILLPLLALMGIASMTAFGSAGLFNRLDLPLVVEISLTILLLDLTVYWQHRLFHRSPILWRLHRVHHSDPDCDVTTGVRFHPLELILSLVIKSMAVVALGASATAVLIFEIVLNLFSMFTHSNLNLPVRLDRWLRILVVTPDMHRIHHSQTKGETDSNYGFFLPWWDHLFRSYRAQPVGGHRDMHIGLKEFSRGEKMRAQELLLLPFQRTGT